jgi:ABC-type dipeptide/oligopeptide/nickel transport system permease component
MQQYIIRRVLLLIPSLLAVYTITFFLMHATPGSPWDRTGRPLPEAVVERLNEKYGLDEPVWRQYLIYLQGVVLRGDLGESYSRQGQDVMTILLRFFPVSLQLGILAMIVALTVGLTLGVVSAYYHNSWIDSSATFLAVVGVSTPNYVVATTMIIVFSIWLGWLPTGGWDGIFSVKVIIPTIALALFPTALLARYTRASLLEVWRSDYIRTARAKGLGERMVLMRHGLRNALVPAVTVAGIAFAEVVTGSFFVESITAVPGIGRYFVTSVMARDYPVIIGTTLLFATIVMVMNLVVDILYTFLDPRLRFD